MTDLEKLAEKVDKIDRRLIELEQRGAGSAQGDLGNLGIELRKEIARLKGRVDELEKTAKNLQAKILSAVNQTP